MKNETESLTSSLEKILTIDGRGRPAKAKLLLEIMNSYESDITVLKYELKKISERTSF